MAGVIVKQADPWFGQYIVRKWWKIQITMSKPSVKSQSTCFVFLQFFVQRQKNAADIEMELESV